MKKYFKLIFAIIWLGVLLNSNSAKAINDEGAFNRGLIVLASTSMTNAMHEILKEFSVKSNISISSSFSSSESLARKIQDGDPANIFISEDSKKMRDLQRKGVLNVFSLSDIAGDELVIVMPKKHYLIDKIKSHKTIRSKLDFLLDNAIMAIPDPESEPAGLYIAQAMEIMKLKDKFDKKTIKTDNNRRALYMASNANNPAIVYASDASTQKDIVIIGKIPQKYYDKIIYQAAIVAEISKGPHINDSEEFVKFLKQENARKVFDKYGFKRM